MDVFTFTFIVGILCCAACTEAADQSNGWNENIDWKSFDEGMALSEELDKPVMLLIHKSWCGACKALKPKFAESKEIEELSSNFIMINTLDDDEPTGPQYSIDGAYIPRLMFIYKGEVVKDLYHEGGNPKYKYYYHSPDGILKTMERAIQTFKLSEDRVTDEL